MSISALRPSLDPSLLQEPPDPEVDLSGLILPDFYKHSRAIGWVNEAYLAPLERTGRGSSSSYFILNIAVFKPRDEVTGGKNALDRVGYTRDRIRGAMGVVPGQEIAFEVAACQIFNRFFSPSPMVPETVMATLASRSFSTTGVEGKITASDFMKSGSLQRYVQKERINLYEMPSSVKEEQIELMMAFDLALYNVDRNSDNVIISRSPDGNLQLNLIDNSLLCSEFFQTKMNVFWSEIDRSKRAFSKTIKDIILSWDPSHVIKVMQEEVAKTMLDLSAEERKTLELSDRQIRTLEFAIIALQEGVKIELTALEIYHIYNKDKFELSPAEKKIVECEGKDIRAVLSDVFGRISEKKKSLEELVDHERKFFAYVLGSDKDIDFTIDEWMKMHPCIRQKRLRTTGSTTD